MSIIFDPRLSFCYDYFKVDAFHWCTLYCHCQIVELEIYLPVCRRGYHTLKCDLQVELFFPCKFLENKVALFFEIGIAFTVLLLCASSLGITSYLNSNDQARLKDILISGLNSEDAPPLGYAVRGLALLGSDIPNKDSICQKLKSKLETQSTEAAFHVGKASSILGCSVQLPAALKDKLESSLTASSGVSEIFHATGALSSFGNQLDAPKIVKALNAALKKDDSISNLGHAFQVASLLEGDVSSIFGRIEDAVVQADQVPISFNLNVY